MTTIRLPEIEWECVLFLEEPFGTELTVYADCTASTKGEAELWCEGLAKRMKMVLLGCEAVVKGTTVPAKPRQTPLALPAPFAPEKKEEPFFDETYFTPNRGRTDVGAAKEDMYD